jgi:hypothetical protein
MSFDGSSEQFVSRLYNDLFQHPADTPGLQSWSAVLNSGGSRDQVALGMLQRSRSIKMV